MKKNILFVEMTVKDTKVGVKKINGENYISLTDLASFAKKMIHLV